MDHKASITESVLECMLFDETAEPEPLPFSLLERITNNFSIKMEVGRGAFAVVFKAMLGNGVVAVKRLTNTYMYEKEFFREIECLMKVKHRNIVRFLGYCVDTQGNMRMHDGKYVMADIQQRLLCFEYLPNGGLDHYIKDPSCGLEWIDRYEIIKGICEGLYHLHQLNIVHLDLKPANILLDENMEPKITDFGISRSFEEDQTRVLATKVLGTRGYIAPEFVSHLITKKYDLYSLGVIIMEIVTGEKSCQGVETVLKSWSHRLSISQRNQECEQIRVCVEIGIECTDIDPANRPVNVKHIIDRLPETYCSELHPLKYSFYPELSESIPCSLDLTNKTDEHVVFRLRKRRIDPSWPHRGHEWYGGVSPRSTCTLFMTTEGEMQSQKTGTDLVVQSCVPTDKTIMLPRNGYECYKFFEETIKLGHAVYEVPLKAIFTPRGEETSSEMAVRPTIMKLIFLRDSEILSTMDAHPTEPWIVIGHYSGNFSIWNHENKTMMDTVKISVGPVYSVKFHATKKWIVARTDHELIHVYDCACVTQIQEITTFRASETFRAPLGYANYSVGTHPTKPYVLSPSMKLWDGDKGWECTQTFGTRGMFRLAFNPDDPNSFAIATFSDHVEVWSLDSLEPDYSLNGHSDTVMCLDFFKRGDRQYLITGSRDCTAKIWDLQKRVCIHTLEGIMSPVIHLISLPGRPYLVTCSKNGSIHVWSSIDFRLKTTVNFNGGGDVLGLVCLMGSRRIAIGQKWAVSIMDIDDEQEAFPSEGNNEDSKCATGQSSIHK